MTGSIFKYPNSRHFIYTYIYIHICIILLNGVCSTVAQPLYFSDAHALVTYAQCTLNAYETLFMLSRIHVLSCGKGKNIQRFPANSRKSSLDSVELDRTWKYYIGVADKCVYMIYVGPYIPNIYMLLIHGHVPIWCSLFSHRRYWQIRNINIYRWDFSMVNWWHDTFSNFKIRLRIAEARIVSRISCRVASWPARLSRWRQLEASWSTVLAIGYVSRDRRSRVRVKTLTWKCQLNTRVN